MAADGCGEAEKCRVVAGIVLVAVAFMFIESITQRNPCNSPGHRIGHLPSSPRCPADLLRSCSSRSSTTTRSDTASSQVSGPCARQGAAEGSIRARALRWRALWASFRAGGSVRPRSRRCGMVVPVPWRPPSAITVVSPTGFLAPGGSRALQSSGSPGTGRPAADFEIPDRGPAAAGAGSSARRRRPAGRGSEKRQARPASSARAPSRCVPRTRRSRRVRGAGTSGADTVPSSPRPRRHVERDPRRPLHDVSREAVSPRTCRRRTGPGREWPNPHGPHRR